MWFDPQDTEDSAGYADPLMDSVFAIMAAVIVAVVALMVRGGAVMSRAEILAERDAALEEAATLRAALDAKIDIAGDARVAELKQQRDELATILRQVRTDLAADDVLLPWWGIIDSALERRVNP